MVTEMKFVAFEQDGLILAPLVSNVTIFIVSRPWVRKATNYCPLPLVLKAIDRQQGKKKKRKKHCLRQCNAM